MSRLVALWILALAASGAMSGAEVYRWVDDDGVVHYSDRPHPDAEEVPIYKAPATARRPNGQPGGENERGLAPPEAPFAYQTFAIQSPVQGETLWNIEGQLEVVLSVEPELQPGHTLRLYLDEEWLEELPGRSNRLRLSEVYRGAHTLRAEVRDRNDLLQAQSQLVSIMVRQTSVITQPNTAGN